MIVVFFYFILLINSKWLDNKLIQQLIHEGDKQSQRKQIEKQLNNKTNSSKHDHNDYNGVS